MASELESAVLRDPASSLTATVVPAAGMIVTSLAEDGAEFLGQRRGLEAYLRDGKTMGIPLLYPWANRLSGTDYPVPGGAVVTLTPGAGGVRADENGLPIHGVLAAYPGWQVSERSANSLTAALDWDAPALLASFPFPHRLTQQVTLAQRTLSIATTVTPTTSAPVPLCFGHHPYLQLPGVARAEWTLATPPLRHLPVDERGIPTGEHAPWIAPAGPLGDTTYDDGFDEVPAGAVFVLSGGGRRIEVTFASNYPAAQLFAPPSDDLVAIEPMAAPTDTLRRGDYPVADGAPVTARFVITVG